MDDPLPAELLRAMTQRRGRPFAFGEIPARRAALVAIDLTTMFFGRSPDEQRMAERLNLLAARLRAMGGTVVWVRPAPFENEGLMHDLLGPGLAALHAAAQRPEDPRNELSDLLDARRTDVHVRKSLFSAFFPGSSTIVAELAERGVEHVIIGGVVTDVCVEASARDAFSCGFRTLLLADGSRGSSRAAHASTLATFHRLFGDVRAVADALSLLRP